MSRHDLQPAIFKLQPILSAYQLEPPVTLFELDEHGSNNTLRGVHTGAGDFVLKAFELSGDRGRLQFEHDLLDWLGRRELPFAVPLAVAARDGCMLTDRDDYRYALYALLPGRQPNEHNPMHALAIGAALGQLHHALAEYPRERRPGLWRYNELHHIHPRVPDPFGLTPSAIGLPDEPMINELCIWWRSELAWLRSLIEQRYAGLPAQMIHGDYCLSNTLFVADTLSAVLDFEFALPDARAIDVASGLQFTLRPWLATPNWQQALAFWSGYSSSAELEKREIEALPELMRLRNMASGVWWLGRHLSSGTPERSAGRLEWVRSCNRTIERSSERLLHTLHNPRRHASTRE